MYCSPSMGILNLNLIKGYFDELLIFLIECLYWQRPKQRARLSIFLQKGDWFMGARGPLDPYSNTTQYMCRVYNLGEGLITCSLTDLIVVDDGQ